jgi:hypothetical protein
MWLKSITNQKHSITLNCTESQACGGSGSSLEEDVLLLGVSAKELSFLRYLITQALLLAEVDRASSAR